MRGIRIWLRVLSFFAAVSPSLTAADESCPVTKAPDPPFVPPTPYAAEAGRTSINFLYGTPALWALVHTHWRLHHDGTKLPYFRQNLALTKENDPRLSVVARRLDGPAALAWNDWANSGHTEHGDFMVTSLDIPAAGCWEVSARYAPTRDQIQTVTYVVWVEP